VVLLAENGPEAQLAARLAGAVACLVKPFRLETLRDVLEPLLALSVAPAE
jgi:CheY-like chemotaxis protein